MRHVLQIYEIRTTPASDMRQIEISSSQPFGTLSAYLCIFCGHLIALSIILFTFARLKAE
jgi:hypothetical protein